MKKNALPIHDFLAAGIKGRIEMLRNSSASFFEILSKELLEVKVELDSEAVLEVVAFSAGPTVEERLNPCTVSRRLTYESLLAPWAATCFEKDVDIKHFLKMLIKNFRNSDVSRAVQTAVIRACEDNCSWTLDDKTTWVSKPYVGDGAFDYLLKHVIPAVQNRLSDGQCGLMLEQLNDATAEAFTAIAFDEFQNLYILSSAKKRYLAVSTITTAITRIARWRVIDEHRKWKKLQARLKAKREQNEKELLRVPDPHSDSREKSNVAEIIFHFKNGLGDELPHAGVVGEWIGDLDVPPACLKGQSSAVLKYLILYHWYGFPQALIAKEHNKTRSAISQSLMKSWKDVLKPWVESKLDG